MPVPTAATIRPGGWPATTKHYVYAWGNNERRAQLKGRHCVIETRGAMGTVLVRFIDTGERVTTSFRALKAEPAARSRHT